MNGPERSTHLGESLHRSPIPASSLARRHPDHRTTWVIVLLARMAPGAMPSTSLLLERLEAADAMFPLVASRLRSPWWIPATGPGLTVVSSGEPLRIAPLQPFTLSQESPLRVAVSSSDEWLLLCAHHFAFDGLGMVMLLRWLLTGTRAVAPDYTRISSPRRPPFEGLRRLLTPADPVAASRTPPVTDTFVHRDVSMSGPGVTARLSRACAAATVAYNARRGRPIRHLGLSVAVGGIDGEGATYRRLDLEADDDIEAAVTTSLADPRVPAELGGLPPGAFLLRPILGRFSDTMLVSNLGRLDLPGVTGIEFYPVARGRSAAAFGAASVTGLPATTLTFRARNVAAEDAAELLDGVVKEVTQGQ